MTPRDYNLPELQQALYNFIQKYGLQMEKSKRSNMEHYIKNI